ncbi:reverse transcriptase domain-containing protein [Citrus sinensis]|nr:reverse transcriptase domain-containing protein [Citrus sinensis]
MLNHRQFIHFKICRNNTFISWVTAVYASPNPMLRRQLWKHMDSIAMSIQGPWLIGGDFNSILYASEKQGGATQNSGVCGNFRQWFDGYRIFDLKFKGPRFTWSRGLLFKRLDRALCNSDWLIKFADNSVLHLPKVASDHRPVLVRFAGAEYRHRGTRPFRFLAPWLTHEHFNSFVKKVWDPQAHYRDAASHFVQAVQKWNREVFGNIFQRKRRLMARINGIQAALERLRNELETVIGQEEILWWQKSRKDELLHGDRNTKFFHQKIIARRRRNRIEAIQDTSGNWLYSEGEIRNYAIDYFSSLYKKVVHSMRMKTGKKGFMAIKVDLEKAYDRINWSFIFDTLQQTGIPIQLSRLVMECVTSARMSILWNGEATAEFVPGRGIRQGDPLSPYIFVLCIERLSHGISHAASIDQAYTIDAVLDNYCRSSEAKVNKSKTKIYLSKNVGSRDAQLLSNVLGYSATNDLGCYLGMPLIHSRINRATYQSILDKVEKQLTGWNAAHLSFAGRITLAHSSSLRDWIIANLQNKWNIPSPLAWECIFGVAVWRLWYWRNRFMVEGKLADSSTVCVDVMARANEIHRLNNSHINEGAGAGGIIRDSVGHWLAGFCMNIGESSVLMAELWGLYQGLHLAWEAGIKRLLVEVDSLCVTQLVSKQVVVPNEFYALVVAIREIISRNWQVSITHIYREANSAADFMANMAHSYPHGLHLFSSPPVGIYSIIVQDLYGVTQPRLIPV